MQWPSLLSCHLKQLFKLSTPQQLLNRKETRNVEYCKSEMSFIPFLSIYSWPFTLCLCHFQTCCPRKEKIKQIKSKNTCILPTASNLQSICIGPSIKRKKRLNTNMRLTCCFSFQTFVATKASNADSKNQRNNRVSYMLSSTLFLLDSLQNAMDSFCCFPNTGAFFFHLFFFSSLSQEAKSKRTRDRKQKARSKLKKENEWKKTKIQIIVFSALFIVPNLSLPVANRHLPVRLKEENVKWTQKNLPLICIQNHKEETLFLHAQLAFLFPPFEIKSYVTRLQPFFLSPFKKQNATNKRVKEKEPKGKVTLQELQVQKEQERKAVTQSKGKKKTFKKQFKNKRQVTRRLDKQSRHLELKESRRAKS